MPPGNDTKNYYDFAHGGKDSIPYPVYRKTYGDSIKLLSEALDKSKLGIREKNEAINRLSSIVVKFGLTADKGQCYTLSHLKDT